MEYYNKILEVFTSLELIPVGSDPESLQLIDRAGKDRVDDIFSKLLLHELDGFDVVKAGNPAKVIVFPSDLDRYAGGHVVVFNGREWAVQLLDSDDLQSYMFNPSIDDIARDMEDSDPADWWKEM